MQTALLVLIVCAAADLVACILLFAFVWVEHRRVRSEAAAAGETVPSAARQLGCLLAGCGLLLVGLWGLVALAAAAG